MPQPTILNAPGPLAGHTLGLMYKYERFDYSIAIAFVTGLENFTPAIPIQNDAHFMCVEGTYTNSGVTRAGGNANLEPIFANGGALVQIIDGRTQKPLQNTRVPVDSIFGHGREPFVWPMPHLFASNSPLGIDITGIGVGPPSMANTTLRLTFSGYKVPRSEVNI